MKPESFIEKLQPDPDGLDFEALREEGLRLVQEMSGDVWSDYNLHDPGVTILEQLCYGLTDVAYRCSFSAADYLASTDGTLDFERLALHRPDDILSCAPLTATDYRKLILAAVPNVDNVWVERLDGGLYRIYALLGEQVDNQRNEGVRKAYADNVGRIYAANRNLCEDLDAVCIVERRPYALHGEIEFDGKRDPARVLGEIYAACAAYLSPEILQCARAELYQDGRAMDDLFDGIMTGPGYIADDMLHEWRGYFSIAELLGIVARIDGVDNVRRLVFAAPGEDETEVIELGGDARYRAAVCLDFPASDDAIGIGLYKGGRTYHASQADVLKEFGRLTYRQQTLRQRKPRSDWIRDALPGGTHREVSDYFSVQHHFPDIYGINANGVPDSATAERKAQALQLKAYLLLFEQVVANFLQGVQEIPRLFSLDESLQQSYFHQQLDNDAVPGVEKIYLDDPELMEAQLAALLSETDDFGDRRNRVLDYLLALYGEKFGQHSLRHFFPHDVDPESEMIRNKLAFLRDIVAIGRDRAAAFNVRKPAGGDNAPGLRKKLALLLGRHTGEEDFHIVEHVLLRPSGQAVRSVPDDFYGFRISIVFPAKFAGRDDNGYRKLAEETVYMNCPAHIHPAIVWLDADAMQTFDALHAKWLGELWAKQPEETDAAAAELADFLCTHGEAGHG